MSAEQWARRFWPAVVAASASVVFVVTLALAPRWGDGACQESYPMRCPVIDIVPGALAGTAIALLVAVGTILAASTVRKPVGRALALLACCAALIAVMVVGANITLLHTMETRY
jgi:hypothetical protein